MTLKTSSAHASTPTVRGCLEAFARALKTDLGSAPDAGLAITINDVLTVAIAPGRNGRLAAFFRIAEASALNNELWISTLSEAATWGVDGENQRFVVVEGHLAILWTPLPQPAQVLLPQLNEIIATALAVTELVARHKR
jgi:hypothetical protein